MSWKLVGEVWGLALTGHRREVLLALAWHARDDGRGAHPGVARLAWETGHAWRTVRRHLRALEAIGVIEAVAYSAGGRGRATEYVIRLEHAERKPPLESVNGVTHTTAFSDIKDDNHVTAFHAPKRGQNDTKRRSFSTKRGHPGDPPTSSTTSITKSAADGGGGGDELIPQDPLTPLECPLAPHTYTGSYSDHLATDARHRFKERRAPRTRGDHGFRPLGALLPDARSPIGDNHADG